MPLDPKFHTTAGLQRFREQIFRENKTRLASGAKSSDAALKFLEQRKKQLEEQAREEPVGHAGSRGQASRSGVVSSTQRHVVDEGYDMVLQTEWAAATEGVCAADPVFRDLNSGTIGSAARTLHVQREESARRVHDTRDRLLKDQASNREWQQRAHQLVEDGWNRARESGLSASRQSQLNRSDLSRIATSDHLYTKTAPEEAHRAATVLDSGNGLITVTNSTGHDFSNVGSRTQSSKRIGLASAGVRAPTFTAERHRELTARVRCVYAPPPPPPRDIFAALDKVSKTNMPRRELDVGQMEAERMDREEMRRRMERLQRELEEERVATQRVSSKLASLKEIASVKRKH